MKVSAAALPFLILAATLGPRALGLPTHGDQGSGSLSLNHELSFVPKLTIMNEGGVHHPTDCCVSYTPRTIQCVNMKSYYTTISECSLPAVIFITKRGQEVCADPRSRSVKRCRDKLDPTTPRKNFIEEKPQ